MWVDEKKKAPITDYLSWLLFLSVFFEIIMLILEPSSIKNAETGKLSFSYVMYASIGILFTTPGPVIALFILLRKEEKITVRAFIKRFLHTPKKVKTFLITGLFCMCALLFAIFCGEPNGSPWYMMPIGFLIMLPLVGFAEETGWRGFLQPMLEKRFPFPVATTIVAAIWCVWHFPIWLQPTSNHYGDSMVGFAINIFVWAFVAAAIYKSTKSVLACAIYHSLIACYAFGTGWFMYVYMRNTGAVGLITVLSWCVFPFIIPDLAKMAIAVIISKRVKKIIVD